MRPHWIKNARLSRLFYNKQERISLWHETPPLLLPWGFNMVWSLSKSVLAMFTHQYMNHSASISSKCFHTVLHLTSLEFKSAYSPWNCSLDRSSHICTQPNPLLAFVRGIHRWPVNSPHKGPVTRKKFPFDDVTMQINMDTPFFSHADHHRGICSVHWKQNNRTISGINGGGNMCISLSKYAWSLCQWKWRFIRQSCIRTFRYSNHSVCFVK